MCSWEGGKDPGSHLQPCALFFSFPLNTLNAGGKEGLLGLEQDAGAPALSPLLLLLQVLGALFLAIGLWAWGEKVRWWGRAWGCYGSKW